MYRIKGSNDISSLDCSCGDLELQPCEDPFPGMLINFNNMWPKMMCNYVVISYIPPFAFSFGFIAGLKTFRVLKRKSDCIIEQDMEESSDSGNFETSKRRQTECADKLMILVVHPVEDTSVDSVEIVKQNNSPFGGSKSHCAVEGCLLSEGFAGLLSNQPRMQFDQERRVS